MSRRGMQVKALLSMGILVGFGSVSTLAAWTGTATATSSISAATVSLAVHKDTPEDASSYELDIEKANWFPGMSQAAMVTVKNAGSVEAPYALSGTMEAGALGKALEVDVFPNGTVTNASKTTGTCSGTKQYSKSTGSQDFPNDPITSGTLAVDESASYCVQAKLPTAAASALQGKTTTVTLTFTATVGAL